jgi:hypothetical protein
VWQKSHTKTILLLEVLTSSSFYAIFKAGKQST